MSRELIAAFIVVWLIGALVGWVVGWMARGDQNRAWHSAHTTQLAHSRFQLSEALAELDQLRTCPPSPPAVVHVHVTPPMVGPGPLASQSLLPYPMRVLDAAPVTEETNR